MYFGNHRISKNWILFLEAQLRRNQWLESPQQALVRAGLNYELNPTTLLGGGYAFIKSYPYGEFTSPAIFPENRIYQQLQIKNVDRKIEWINRFRLEQRWIKTPVLSENVYVPGDPVFLNRFRYSLRASIPFKGSEIVDGSYYISAYNEIMFSFGKNIGNSMFDQNRAYLALGYKLKGLGRIEIGYFNQTISKSSGSRIEYNHTLQVSLTTSIPFVKVD